MSPSPSESQARLPFPFIVGCGRSGTTLLRALCDGHPHLAIPPESHFVVGLAPRAGQVFDPDAFLAGLATSERFQLWELDVSFATPPADYAALGKNPTVKAEIQKAFDELNKTLPSYETIKKFEVLDNDLTLESGDLTPTLKVKRKVVTAKYMKVLDSMYDDKLD